MTVADDLQGSCRESDERWSLQHPSPCARGHRPSSSACRTPSSISRLPFGWHCRKSEAPGAARTRAEARPSHLGSSLQQEPRHSVGQVCLGLQSSCERLRPRIASVCGQGPPEACRSLQKLCRDETDPLNVGTAVALRQDQTSPLPWSLRCCALSNQDHMPKVQLVPQRDVASCVQWTTGHQVQSCLSAAPEPSLRSSAAYLSHPPPVESHQAPIGETNPRPLAANAPERDAEMDGCTNSRNLDLQKSAPEQFCTLPWRP
mmetsp:Transcript_152859/g.266449  ORF Transcript_152859/g.266449 Transcript_152859/m.266449 type:complete len:260 (-) Transcript_152859:1571-2350(-)